MFDSKTDLCNIVLFKTDLCRGYSSDTAVYYKLWSSDLSIFLFIVIGRLPWSEQC